MLGRRSLRCSKSSGKRCRRAPRRPWSPPRRRLVEELPEGTPPEDVHRHWLESARRDDAARGVIWPNDRREGRRRRLGLEIFPNMTILQGNVFALCYRARPYGDSPHKCIFESYAIERFPEGQEPKTEWIYAEPTARRNGAWCSPRTSRTCARCRRACGRAASAAPAQSAPGAEGHQLPPQPRQYMGTGGAAAAQSTKWPLSF